MGTFKQFMIGLLPFWAATQVNIQPAYNPSDEKSFISGMKKDRSKAKKKSKSKRKKIKHLRRIVKHSRSINRRKAA